MSIKKIALLSLVFILAAEPSFAGASLSYEYREYKSLVGRQKNTGYSLRTKTPFIGVVSHHLPTASPLIDNFYYQLRKGRPNIKTFVVIGPDHSERCRQKFSVSDSNVSTMYGELQSDKRVFQALLSAGAKSEAGCFEGEHSIGIQANYIRKFFPTAKIVPILLSYSAKQRDFEILIETLKKNRADIFVLASVDFSHYLEARQADAVDAVSRKMINALDGSSFTLKQIDSPATIKIILGLAKKLQLKPEIIEHRNSFDYNGAYKNTTSYFSILF
ncbi:AmmeMemoRadiSam system protein B [Candidatus Falkowbacteria bacterium]|nr:AmmeMemoRadiSam system protein B [Candidatus Falkowbacteria bacterium]